MFIQHASETSVPPIPKSKKPAGSTPNKEEIIHRPVHCLCFTCLSPVAPPIMEVVVQPTVPVPSQEPRLLGNRCSHRLGNLAIDPPGDVNPCTDITDDLSQSNSITV